MELMSKPKKDADLNIRVTRQERDNLKKYAAGLGLTMSEVVLSRIDKIIHPEENEPQQIFFYKLWTTKIKCPYIIFIYL